MKYPRVKEGHREQIREPWELSVGVLSITGFGVIKPLYNTGMGRETAAQGLYLLMLI